MCVCAAYPVFLTPAKKPFLERKKPDHVVRVFDCPKRFNLWHGFFFLPLCIRQACIKINVQKHNSLDPFFPGFINRSEIQSCLRIRKCCRLGFYLTSFQKGSGFCPSWPLESCFSFKQCPHFLGLALVRPSLVFSR